ncbi:MAG: hypothetical protein AAFP02_03235, partial [Bacteroidota bacterium]
MKKPCFHLIFSLLVYLLAWGTIVYYLDFFTGYLVPKSIDDGLHWHWSAALLWNLCLLLGVGMLYERAQKDSFLRQLPENLERSTQILIYVGGLMALISLW